LLEALWLTGQPARPGLHCLCRSSREEYLHIVDLVFGVLREAVHYSMRSEKDGWSFLEAILASLHADRPSHA
jgi:hypothetical protein